MISQIRKLIQDKLISGVNIKTINGSDILGPGNLVVSGGGGVPDGDKGDITVSGSGTVWTIDNNAVTNAKINDVSATKVSGTKSEFDAACTDGNFLYVGDVTQYTDEMAQDAVGGMAANSTFVNLSYVDATPSLTPSLSATGTPSNTTFLRGDNTWATPTSADPAGWTTIVKSANQDVTNNAAYQDDTELQFSVVAGGYYMVELDICYSGNNTTGDYVSRFTLTSGTMQGQGQYVGMTGAGAIQTVLILVSASASSSGFVYGVNSATFNYLHYTKIQFAFSATANGTFKYQFANASAAVGRTSRTNKGSILKYKKIN
jgi:hypothetical protein